MIHSEFMIRHKDNSYQFRDIVFLLHLRSASSMQFLKIVSGYKGYYFLQGINFIAYTNHMIKSMQ